MISRSVAAAAPAVSAEPCREASIPLAFGASQTDGGTLLDGGFELADHLVVNDAQHQFITGNERQPVDLTFDELFAFEGDTLGQNHCSGDVSLSLNHVVDQQAGSWCTWMQGNVSLAVVTEDSSLKSQSHLLAVFQSGRSHAQYNADLIIQSLRSLPTMMLRRETFPWFIHPHSQLLSKSPGATLPKALSNCMSIAQMFALRTSDTNPFLRHAIEAEYRRFVSEV